MNNTPLGKLVLVVIHLETAHEVTKNYILSSSVGLFILICFLTLGYFQCQIFRGHSVFVDWTVGVHWQWVFKVGEVSSGKETRDKFFWRLRKVFMYIRNNFRFLLLLPHLHLLSFSTESEETRFLLSSYFYYFSYFMQCLWIFLSPLTLIKKGYIYSETRPLSYLPWTVHSTSSQDLILMLRKWNWIPPCTGTNKTGCSLWVHARKLLQDCDWQIVNRVAIEVLKS